MRLPSRRRPASRRRPRSAAHSLLALSALVSTASAAIEFTALPASNLDLANLGQVGIAGDFYGLSLAQYEGQTESPFSTNGSESLLAQLPNGQLVPIVRTDASIQAMCQFVRSSGEIEGVVIGGNFTSLNGVESQGIALFNPNTTEITQLEGLSGQVNTLLCDQESDTVYIGGNFRTENSINAIAWDRESGWKNLAFAGFNGPVNSITKTSGGKMVFGGSFTGLGNTTFSTVNDELQVINLATADIEGALSSTRAGFSDPKNIICKSDVASEGSGDTWLMADGSRGSWTADLGFGFEPTTLRLSNTHFEGRGTKTWRFTVLPDNGIMNFTYIDPATGRNQSCTSECPLSDDPEVDFQDFFFVNRVGMDQFRIDVSEFYGAGAGFNGIQLFQKDIFTYAVNEFNSAACAGVTGGSSATATGPWETSPSFLSNSEYLTAPLSSPIDENSASIVFTPDIRESGFYSVNLYTPGCMQDNTCATRGQVSITVTASSDEQVSLSLYQTNNFPKYDQVYLGFIQAGAASVRMTPLSGQGLDEMTFVAQRVGFTALNSTGGLNGLFEFDPTDDVINNDDFSDSEFDRLSTSFSSGSAVNSLITAGDVTYIAGNFTSDSAQNIIAVSGDEVRDLDGGLDGTVHAMHLNDTKLYLGGEFTNVREGLVEGLNNVAVYDTGSNSFSPLGAGVDGRVRTVVPVKMNLGDENQEVVISLTGDFAKINAFGGSAEASVPGFAVWVPSRSNWLSNLSGSVPGLTGVLSTSILNLPEGDSLLAGSVASSQVGANGAVSLYGKGDVVTGLPARLRSATSNTELTKRDISSPGNNSGVVNGAFYSNGGRNVTILAGHFDAQGSDGSTVRNLAFIDGANDNTVSGIDSSISEDSTFVALGVAGDTLFAGGDVSGTANGENVSGIVSYNLADKRFNDIPPLTGADRTVSTIAVRPNTADFYVGGSFEDAGSLGCPGVCYYRTENSQWNRPGINLGGSAHCLMWRSETILVAGGSLTVNDTSTFLARYDTETTTWDRFPGADDLPGPVEVLVPASDDGEQVWVAGHDAGGAPYLMKYDGSEWKVATNILGDGSEIHSLQMFTVSESHDNTDLVDRNRVLLLAGRINIPDSGSASTTIYDGQTMRPFVYSTKSGNSAGTVSRFFTEKSNFFESSGGNMPLVFIVLIGLAISLAIIALLVIAGVVMDRIRKKREGYSPAPTSMYDRSNGLQRIPPAELLDNFAKESRGAPHV